MTSRDRRPDHPVAVSAAALSPAAAATEGYGGIVSRCSARQAAALALILHASRQLTRLRAWGDLTCCGARIQQVPGQFRLCAGLLTAVGSVRPAVVSTSADQGHADGGAHQHCCAATPHHHICQLPCPPHSTQRLHPVFSKPSFKQCGIDRSGRSPKRKRAVRADKSQPYLIDHDTSERLNECDGAERTVAFD